MTVEQPTINRIGVVPAFLAVAGAGIVAGFVALALQNQSGGDTWWTSPGSDNAALQVGPAFGATDTGMPGTGANSSSPARVGMSMGMGPSGGTPNATSGSGPGAAMRPAGAPASTGTTGNPATQQALKLVVDPPPLFGVRNAAGNTVDAIVPATITLRAGAVVELTIQNWDTMAHAVAGLGLNVTVPPGSHTSPSTVAVDFVPSRAGRFVWQSTTNGAFSSMTDPGYMTGVVAVNS